MAVDLEYYGVPPADYREQENRTRITASAAQTTFTAPYSVGFVDVYFNGAKLDPFTEFTGTDGANIILSAAAAAGDIVEIISRAQVQLTNIYTQQQVNALVPVFAVATGTGDAQIAITNPSFAAYSDGLVIKIRTAGQNATTTPTINCNSIGVKTIVSNNAGAALYTKDWISGSEITLRYNQTLDKLVLVDGQTTILTPAQFDNSNQFASTAFVQRALGNFQAFTILNSNTTLTYAQSGSVFEVAGTLTTITLPAPTTQGITYTIVNSLAIPITLTTLSGQIFWMGPTGAASQFLNVATSVQLLSDGNNWVAINGSGASVLAAVGYQKLNTGLIIQWGNFASSGSGDVGVTFPIAFPHALYSLTFGNNSESSFGAPGSSSQSLTGFNGAGWQSAGRVPISTSYLAIGS